MNNVVFMFELLGLEFRGDGLILRGGFANWS